MVLSNDDKWLAILNKSSLELIEMGNDTISKSLHIGGGASFKGISFSSDNRFVYASQARDRIVIAELINDELKW